MLCVGRYLFVLGHLLRFGIDVVEATQLPNGKSITVPDCQAMFMTYLNSPASAIRYPSCLLRNTRYFWRPCHNQRAHECHQLLS